MQIIFTNKNQIIINLFKLLSIFVIVTKRVDKIPIKKNKHDDATMFAGQKEFNVTSIPIYKVSKHIVRNWNDGQKHPSYMNPAYRYAQQYNKRRK